MRGEKERQDRGPGQTPAKSLSAHRFFWATVFRLGPVTLVKILNLLDKFWAKGSKWADLGDSSRISAI